MILELDLFEIPLSRSCLLCCKWLVAVISDSLRGNLSIAASAVVTVVVAAGSGLGKRRVVRIETVGEGMRSGIS
jgi:hypothetical protein